MADIELVVKIPEELKRAVDNNEEYRLYTESVGHVTMMAIKYGKSLDAVLDEIKAKIEDESYLSYDDNPRHIIDESWVLEIIDKYREESDIKKRKELSHKPCINYEDGCEEWAGCPCVHYKAGSEDTE